MEYLEVYQDEGINMYVDIGDSDTKITEKSVQSRTTTMTTVQPGIIARPVNEDGTPLEGARVILQCTDPPGEFVAVENTAGEYAFGHGIPVDGPIDCELIVTKDG